MIGSDECFVTKQAFNIWHIACSREREILCFSAFEYMCPALSLIDASAGVLTISGVTMEYIIMKNNPLVSVSVSEGAFSATGENNFDSITRNIDSGAVFTVIVDAGSVFVLDYLTFTECTH